MASEELPTELLPAQGSARAAVPPTGELIGRTLGKFTIVARLGQGGSGEVFRAEQLELGRSAVIKILRRDLEGAHHRIERFLREAKLASQLDHPYAGHVYGFGAERDGLLWIAMEHVRGVTLDELIAQRGRMPAAVFGPLFERLCEVVHSAHELGIVHRDIKGSNVMVIERAGQLLPKLLDFGIAKGGRADTATSPGADEPDALTAHGATLGSPHYMAPEQWASPGDVDARADVYALGVLAYRCIAGVLPFHGVARADLPEAHTHRAPPPLPSTVTPAAAEVILRGLAKPAAARWPTALAFGEALRRAIGGRAPEIVPALDPEVRDTWVTTGPQPIADAVAHLASATTTVEADGALRELVAITCRWLAVLALAHLGEDPASAEVRERARAVVGREDAAPWLELARAVAVEAAGVMAPVLRTTLAKAEGLAVLAARLDDRERVRTAAALAADIPAIAAALHPLTPLLAYALVVGRGGGADSWQGARRRDRPRVVVWGEPLADGEVALLDPGGARAVRLSPLVQVIAPLPAAEPELFLLWRSGRDHARLMAAPWGFERDDEAAAARLALLTTEDTDTLAEQADDRSPYPGLAAYGVDDADRFVGREREIEALTNRLVRSPMLAVLGPSGAGKSSFLHAGVMPRLAEHHALLTMRPGRHPLHALAALPEVCGDTENTDGLARQLRMLGEAAPKGLVLVIDQLEELVTLCADPRERTRFTEVLAAAADGPLAPVRIVVTLRDDFASVLESEEAVRGRFDVFVLATPLPEALRRIVTEPARRANVVLAPQVVEDMVAEVAGRPASLPLLSFTASQLWQSRDRAARRITHDAYLALGGVAGALATYADQLHENLGRADQEVVRDLFSRLVASDGTRIPAPRHELDQLPGARGVLAHLIDARLLVVREDEGADIVEVVHECLAERWPRLARWRTEDASDRALLADIGAATRRWLEAGRRADLLWRGQALLELRRLATRSSALTEDERAFAREADRAESRARRRRRVLVGATMAVLAVVATVMAYLSIEANHSRAAAERSAGDARLAARLAEDRLTQGLIAQGRRELNDNRALASLAYFAEALRRGADTPGLRFMLGVAMRSWRDEELVLRGDLTAITALDDGFAVGNVEGHVQLFDAQAKQVADLALGVEQIVALRAVGRRLAVIGRGGVVLVDLTTRTAGVTIPTATLVNHATPGPGPDEITVISDTELRVHSIDGTLRRHLSHELGRADVEPVWGTGHLILARGESIEAIDLTTMKVRTLAGRVFAGPTGSADGTTIGYIDRANMVHILDGTGRETGRFTPRMRTEQLFVSATGDQIGAIGDSVLGIHDHAGAPTGQVLLSPIDQEVAVRLRGPDIWTGSNHGVIRHYHHGRLVGSQPSHLSDIEDLRIAGDHLISLGYDRSVVVQRADAHQVEFDAGPCSAGAILIAGLGVGYVCEGGLQHVYLGRRLLGVIPETVLRDAVREPGSGRVAFAASTLRVMEADGRVIATAPGEAAELLAFEDAQHLLAIRAAGAGSAVWRLDLTSGAWSEALDLPDKVLSIAVGAGGIVLGTPSSLQLWRDGRQLHQIPTGGSVDTVAVSGDGLWISANLSDGGTLLVDSRTGAVDRRLEPVDALGVASALDQHGDLVVRTSRGTLTIWERATGDSLVWNLEFLGGAFAAVFDASGRLELAAMDQFLVDIPRETRPVLAILRAIECRVPLRVVGTRLEAAPTNCAAP